MVQNWRGERAGDFALMLRASTHAQEHRAHVCKSIALAHEGTAQAHRIPADARWTCVAVCE
jgi:hypothetical protein